MMENYPEQKEVVPKSPRQEVEYLCAEYIIGTTQFIRPMRTKLVQYDTHQRLLLPGIVT